MILRKKLSRWRTQYNRKLVIFDLQILFSTLVSNRRSSQMFLPVPKTSSFNKLRETILSPLAYIKKSKEIYWMPRLSLILASIQQRISY